MVDPRSQASCSSDGLRFRQAFSEPSTQRSRSEDDPEEDPEDSAPEFESLSPASAIRSKISAQA
ncbi:MAG: hypothetical protein AAGK32_07510, partial [Actinomycetota bacterium]